MPGAGAGRAAAAGGGTPSSAESFVVPEAPGRGGGCEGECPRATCAAPPPPSRRGGERRWEGRAPWGRGGDRGVCGWEVGRCKLPHFAGRAAPGFLAPDLCLMNCNMN